MQATKIKDYDRMIWLAIQMKDWYFGQAADQFVLELPSYWASYVFNLLSLVLGVVQLAWLGDFRFQWSYIFVCGLVFVSSAMVKKTIVLWKWSSGLSTKPKKLIQGGKIPS